jgi:hypothetical protein
MKKIPPKTKIDISKIKRSFPFFELFLAIFEGLLGYWFFRAENALERLFAGFLMIFLLEFYIVYVVPATEETV